MRIKTENINIFYNRNIGKIVKTIINDEINKIWQNTNGLDCLGFGFSTPYLGNFEKSRKYFNYNFEFNDALDNKNAITGYEDITPFKDASFDRILCIHALEEAENPQKMLRELWRILAPEGKIILIVPNRRGAWARIDNIPFGHGRPYSLSQLQKILNDSMFEIICSKRILFVPPMNLAAYQNMANIFEKSGQILCSAFGGLLFFEIRKRLFIAPPMNEVSQKIDGHALSANFMSKHHEFPPKE